MIRLAIVIILLLLFAPAFGRDDGRYAQSFLREWFDSLRSDKGPCCSVADGQETEYDIRDGSYWAPIDGEWLRVPDNAVLTVPNRFGRAMKWLTLEDGKRVFRCFIPAGGV